MTDSRFSGLMEGFLGYRTGGRWPPLGAGDNCITWRSPGLEDGLAVLSSCGADPERPEAHDEIHCGGETRGDVCWGSRRR